ncbi:MBG domain-containing protein [Tenacibaculum sp. 190524A05c]|uniref:MBG domain-containing protein n=1 Tax=Tenacibaculum platacis TaxID=3137852 RepID=UPI0032B0F4EB
MKRIYTISNLLRTRSLLLLLLLTSVLSYGQLVESENNNTPGASGVQKIYTDTGFSGDVASGDTDYWQISKVTGDTGVYTYVLNTYFGTSNRAPVFLEKREGAYDGTLVSTTQIHYIGHGTSNYNLNIDYSGGDFYYVLRIDHANFYDSYNYGLSGFTACSSLFFDTGISVTATSDNSLTLNGLSYNVTMAAFGQQFVVSISDSNTFTNHQDGFMDDTVNTVYSGSGDQVVYRSTDGLTTNPNIVVTGLTAGTEYFIKATVARNCTGYYINSTGQTLSAATCGVVPSPITSIDLSPESETQFRINSFTGGSANHASSSLGYVVKINTVNSFTNPINGVTLPTANSVYAGSGEQVLYVGNSATPNLTVTGLSSLTNYYVKVYTYNSCSGNNYFESTGYSTTLLSCGPPPNGYNVYMATGGGSVTATSLSPIYNRQNTLNPSGILVYISDVNSFTHPESSYTTIPTGNADYVGSGQQLILSGGPSNFFAPANNLIPNTTYYFRSYAYYTCGGTSYVNLNDYKEITLTTCNYSDNLVSNPVFGSITDSSMELNSFTELSPSAPATTPDGYIIRMNTTNSFSSISNGTAVPSGDTNYSGNGEQVIYSGNSTSPNLNITGLSANTTYYFNIVAYYPSCHLNGILYQQSGYTFSKTNDTSLVTPTITFNDINKFVGDANFNLVATSNSGGAISYQILNQTGLQATTLSGTNNATVSLGTAGTVTVEATQEPSGGFAGGTTTATLTITAPDATIGGDPFLLINSTLDLSTQITTNSNGPITYSIVGEPLGSSINGNILTSGGTPGGIILKVSQAATPQYAATEFYTLVLIWDGTNFKFDRVFNLFDTTLQPGETLQLQEAKSFQNSAPVTYTIVAPDATGSSVNNTTNVFTAGNPGAVTLRATSPDGTFYNASSKDVTITIEGTSQTITFNALSDVTYGDANFNLTATASSGLAVSYVSSDPTVASISGSTVTIHKAGTVNITASQVGGGIYFPASDVVQSLTVNPITIVNQNVSLDTTGSVLCNTSATVSIDGSQTSVNYYLRDNNDNSIIEGPVAGTGNAVSFATEQLSSDKAYNVIAVQDNQTLPTATNTLQMTTIPSASVQTLDVKTVDLSQPNGQSAVVSVENSQTGVVYYLQDNTTNEVLQGPLAGTGADVSFNSDAITADKTYKVIGTDASSSNGLRNTLSFDNVDDYVSIPSISSYLTNSWQATIETWVKIPASDATDVNASIITSEGYAGAFGVTIIPFYINISGGQIFAGNYNADPDDGGTLNTPGYTYPVDTWIHVAATMDNSSINFYVNGVLIGSNGISSSFETFALISNIRLGRNYEATSNSTKLFGGQLAQTRIWNGVRTQSEISSNMGAEYTTPQTNLVLNYNYNQTSGTSVTDESSNSNTGTLQNAVGDATNWVKDLFTDSPCGFVNMNNTVTATYVSLQDQIITFNSLSDVTYGDADFSLNATSDSGLVVTYASSDTSVVTVSGDVVTVVGNGTVTITASQAGDATYNPATDVQQSLTVNKKDVLLIASGSKEYGEPEPNIGYSLFPGSSLVSGDSFSGNLVREPGEDVGDYAINLGTLTAGPNYNISFPVSPTFDIFEREIEVTADAKTKVEGEVDPALTYQITSGTLAGSDAFTGALTRATGETFGDYTISQGTLALNANYTITFVGNTFTINRDAVARWDGSTSSVWNVATNFEDDVTPLATDNYVIPNVTTSPNIASGVVAQMNSLTVEALSSLVISEDGGAVIENNFDNSGTITITSTAATSGTLVVKGTANGTVTYERGGLLANKWSIVTAPVTGQSIKEFAENAANNIRVNPTVTPNRIAIGYYDDSKPAGSKWTYYTTDDIITNALTFEKGRSYIVSRATDGAVTFTGTIETDNVTKTVAASQWNAVGNPYTAYLPANGNGGDNFIMDNISKFDPVNVGVYVWDSAQNKYVPNSLVGSAKSIAPGQGFFVRTTTGVTDVLFKESLRSAQSVGGVFNRGTTPNPSIELTVASNGVQVNTKVNYNSKATLGLDPGYDLGNFDGASLDVYTHLIDGTSRQNFVQQTLPNDDIEEYIIPVGLKANAGSEIEFSAKSVSLPNGIEVYLEDKLTNEFIKLEESMSHTVSLSEKQNGTGRFYLHAKSSTLTIPTLTLDNIRIYNTTSELVVEGIQDMKFDMTMYNALGSKIFEGNYQGNGNNRINLPQVETGVYFVKIATEVGVKDKKIIIKK